MDRWHFFAWLYGGLLQPVFDTVTAQIGAVTGAVRPVGLALTVLWLIVSGIDLAMQRRTIHAILRDLLFAGACVSLLTGGAYLEWVGNLFLHGIPDWIGGAMGATGTAQDVMDKVLRHAVKAALTAYDSLAWGIMAVPLGIGIIVFLIVALVASGFCFGVFTIAAVVNALAVFVGPIFIGLMTVPLTRRYAMGWLSVLVGGVTAQLIALATLNLLAPAEALMLTNTAKGIATGDDSILMLVDLGELGLLMFFVAIVMKQAPRIAWAIGGGFHHDTSQVERATFGAAQRVSHTAQQAVTSGAGAATRATVARIAPTTATGRNLGVAARTRPPGATGPTMGRRP